MGRPAPWRTSPKDLIRLGNHRRPGWSNWGWFSWFGCLFFFFYETEMCKGKYFIIQYISDIYRHTYPIISNKTPLLAAKGSTHTMFCRFQLSALHLLCQGLGIFMCVGQPATMSFIKSLSEVLGQAGINDQAFLPVRTCKTVHSQQRWTSSTSEHISQAVQSKKKKKNAFHYYREITRNGEVWHESKVSWHIPSCYPDCWWINKYFGMLN